MVGRGRGRGRGLGVATANGSDEDDAPQPPKLFPDIDLPPADPVTPEQEELLAIWTRLETAWRESPCHLAPAGADGAAAAAADSRLADVLTLHPSVFPAELFSRADADAAAARAGAPGAQAVFWRSAAARAAAAESAGGSLFERLEALERQGGGVGGDADAGGEAGVGPGGGGAAAPTPATADGDDDPAAVGGLGGDDTDGDDPDGDDYLVGEAFDDDEEYGDDDDGDAEPTY